MNETSSIKIFYKLITKKIKFISAITFLVVALTVAYGFIMPKTYQSTTTILPATDNKGGGGMSAFISSMLGGGGGGMLTGLGGSATNNQTRLFVDILLSRASAKYIVDSLNLRNNENFVTLTDEKLYSSISKMLEIDIEKSGLLSVSVKTQTGFFANETDKKLSAKLSADIANYSVKALDHILRHKNTTSSHQSRVYLEEEIRKYNVKLDSVSNKLMEFQNNNKVFDPEKQTVALVDRAIEIGTELSTSQAELNLLKIQYTNAHPRIKILESQIEYLKNQYLQVQEGNMEKDAFSYSLKKVPEYLKEYTNLARDKEVIQQVIIFLETQRHQEAIQEAKDIPIIEQLDVAVAPAEKFAPSLRLMAIVSFLCSLILTTIFVVLTAHKKGSLNS